MRVPRVRRWVGMAFFGLGEWIFGVGEWSVDPHGGGRPFAGLGLGLGDTGYDTIWEGEGELLTAGMEEWVNRGGLEVFGLLILDEFQNYRKEKVGLRCYLKGK